MSARPLAGLRVLEFSHTVMGPTAGLLFAELGADVIKVEPAPDGDRTRRLGGFGAGFFAGFNRNKRSLAIDLKSTEGQAVMHRLVPTADVVLENFGPGTMERLNCGWEHFQPLNDRLIYLALKGYLAGPYEHRPALDEVVQMMGGLAYINGGENAPRRIAPSANDILGGTFGVVGALAALHDRNTTGKGRHIRAGLFENNLVLMAQFIAQHQMTGIAPKPFGARRQPPWGVYDIFDTADGGRVFVAVVSDAQWQNFARDFMPAGWADDARLKTSVQREAARSWLVPGVAEVLKQWKTDALCEALEKAGLSYGPIREPIDLLDDPHLLAGGALMKTKEPGGGMEIAGAALPLEFDGLKAPKRSDPPQVGEQTRSILKGLGMDEAQIAALFASGAVTETKK